MEPVAEIIEESVEFLFVLTGSNLPRELRELKFVPELKEEI